MRAWAREVLRVPADLLDLRVVLRDVHLVVAGLVRAEGVRRCSRTLVAQSVVAHVVPCVVVVRTWHGLGPAPTRHVLYVIDSLPCVEVYVCLLVLSTARASAE